MHETTCWCVSKKAGKIVENKNKYCEQATITTTLVALYNRYSLCNVLWCGVELVLLFFVFLFLTMMIMFHLRDLCCCCCYWWSKSRGVCSNAIQTKQRKRIQKKQQRIGSKIHVKRLIKR